MPVDALVMSVNLPIAGPLYSVQRARLSAPVPPGKLVDSSHAAWFF